MSTPPTAHPPTPTQLQDLLNTLGRGLLERDTAVHLALLAALAGEHVLLIGPPGTAKSALARRLHAAFDAGPYFERLLTRFSTPEELFGPLSLKALEHDRYERLVDGFLPTAGIAFLDEVFKANSAILNALLTLLNEREFDNGTQRLRAPLVAVVAASNEVPADEALQAFYDRFLVRVPVSPVGESSFQALLSLSDPEAPRVLQPLTTAACQALAAAAQQVALGDDFVAGCAALRQWLEKRKAPLSDRRWRRFVGLARTAAASENRPTLDVLDLWLVPYVASSKPDDAPALQQWFLNDALALPASSAPWLARAVEAFEHQLDIEQRAPREDALGDDGAGKIALARAIGLTETGPADDLTHTAMPRLVSERLQAEQRRRWSSVHIQARVEQVQEIETQVTQARQAWAADHNRLRTAMTNRLWMPPALRQSLLGPYESAEQHLRHVADRLAHTRQGFADLPCSTPAETASVDGEAVPPPVAWAVTE